MVKSFLMVMSVIAGLFFLVAPHVRIYEPIARKATIKTQIPAPASGQGRIATNSATAVKDESAPRPQIKQDVPIVKKESVTQKVIITTIISQMVASSAPLRARLAPATATSSASSIPVLPQKISAAPSLPSLDEEAIFRAVVKIECSSEDRKGKYVASGFAMPHGVIVTAAHFVKDSGSDTCQVIFPRDRAPSHYLFGKTEDREVVRKRHDEQGIDVAFIFMPLLAAYLEAHAVFPDAYPFIPYPVCASPALLGDTILHFGYPSSFQNNSYLDESDGKAAAYADINGITEELSEDQSYLFKSPVFKYTNDQLQLHPYLVSRSPSFYGDSGGLGFDATRQCIIGPDRGGTIGGAAGENFSVFMVLGWEGARQILP